MTRPELTANAADRARALALCPVSRETEVRLDRFVALIAQWQQRINLIAPSTGSKLWTRHIADSLQLLTLAPAARIWVDLGSGGGFPGMVVACALADTPEVRVHLVESNLKKAAFLRVATRAVSAPAIVHAERIAEFLKHAPAAIDVVTARAVAPLAKLLAEAGPLLKTGVVGLFPKGQNVDAELTDLPKYWQSHTSLLPSRTDSRARIVVVRA